MTFYHLMHKTVDERRLSHTSFTGDEQIGLSLTAKDFVDDGNLVLKANDLIHIACTCNGRHVGAILGDIALAAGSRCVLSQFCPLHIGSLYVGTAAHLRTNLRRGERQGLELVKAETDTWRYQRG